MLELLEPKPLDLSMLFAADFPTWTVDHPTITWWLYRGALVSLAFLALSFALQWRKVQILFGVRMPPSPDATEPLIPLGKPPRLKILSAHWGVEGALGGDPDKVDCLLEKQTGNIFTARVCGDLFHGSIPADGKLRLKVKYSFDGHEDTVVRQDGEYLMLPEDPYLKAKLEKFRPLQLDALDIERDIGWFLKEIGPRPALTAPGVESGWNSWYTRLTIGYKNQFAPRIEKLLLSASGEIRAPRLGLDGSGIRNEKELHAVRIRLICFAYEQDGLLLEAKE